jgi:chemosensory pili system protein ChpB (putative protein-glutamate methylesterase)
MSSDSSEQPQVSQRHSIGLVADSSAAMMQLRKLVDMLGQTVTYALTPEQTRESKPLSPSLWLVVSEDAADVFDALSDWSDSPIFLADEMPTEQDGLAYKQWHQRLLKKLAEELKCTLPERENPDEVVGKTKPSFRDVWVLAASLGGPEAVAVFLEYINPRLPVAFVYAQHIEPNFDKMLPTVVGKNADIEVSFCASSDKLRPSCVSVLPSHVYAQIDSEGRVIFLPNKKWLLPYTPNIDQVIENVAEFYQDQMGIIIFSGMCDDGAKASLALKDKGVELWAQEPSECICPAMPEAVINSGKVDFIAGAKALAERLNQKYFP